MYAGFEGGEGPGLAWGGWGLAARFWPAAILSLFSAGVEAAEAHGARWAGHYILYF